MLSIEDAIARILSRIPPNGRERLPLALAYGRVLAAPICARLDLPLWDNSAMDGYAVRAADTPGPLRVIDRILAGEAPRCPVLPGTAIRIMTGAPIPEGADAVVMQEDTTRADGSDTVEIRSAARPGQHVRAQGADLRAGSEILPAGRALNAGAIGLCAAIGLSHVTVAQRPRVAILSTGSELRAPGEALSPGQIWSSNDLALAALVEQAGAVPVHIGTVPDDLPLTRAAFADALRCGIVVSTGGVSVGEHDFVKEALALLGVEIGFWKVWMKPGKPLAFARTADDRMIFGLPGNPVSCMVNFFQFVRPLIRRMLGDPAPFLPILRATLTRPWRRRPDRPELVRVRLHVHDGDIRADVIGHQGSGNLAGMAAAHGFLLAAHDATELSGSVPVQVFDTGFLSAAGSGYPWTAAPPPDEGECC